MTSWKTTMFGIAGLIGAIATAATALLDNDPLTNPNWTAIISAGTVAFGLIFAKDSNVTGGTVKQ
jgi:putative flippase GtrA